MTDNHTNKLLKRYNNDTYIKSVKDKSIRLDAIKNILNCFDKRVYNKVTQEEIALYCGVSVQTIKRFENLEVDSLELYLNYINALNHFPNSRVEKSRKYIRSRYMNYEKL